jgi:hypothetical protein
MRERTLMDEISALDYAGKCGYEKGLEIGKRLGEEKIIKKMLLLGVGESFIAEVTDLTYEEVLKFEENME